MSAELSGVICGGIVLLPHVYVTCMCVYVNVVACAEKFCWTARIASFVLIIIIRALWRYGEDGLPALRMAAVGPQRRSD